MMKRQLCALIGAVTLLSVSLPAGAWGLWDEFRTELTDGNRVIDYSDARRITTSEGQSYALFFALVADDRAAFDSLVLWTEKNLSKGDMTKLLPSWLWGQTSSGAGGWGVIDSNNAADSDMWIAYALLEGGRLWNDPALTAKGRAMLELLKKEVRDIPNLGAVILPGRTGFEKEAGVTLNPSYAPLFILKRFALEDPYWLSVYDGSLRMLLRSAPNGYAPEWARFDKRGRFVTPEGRDFETGSYNAIRTYLWAGMMSPADPAREMLRRQFEPMVKATRAMNLPPEVIHIVNGTTEGPGSAGFGACLLPLLGNDRTAGYIRTLLADDPVSRDRYYSSTLVMFGLGFDERRYAFDEAGRVVFPRPELAPDFTKPAAPAGK